MRADVAYYVHVPHKSVIGSYVVSTMLAPTLCLSQTDIIDGSINMGMGQDFSRCWTHICWLFWFEASIFLVFLRLTNNQV